MIIKKDAFIHHVFLWLKDAERKEDLIKLIDPLKKLCKVSVIKDFHIGKPAGTNRNVIDNTWSVSWLLLFENADDQQMYQADPIHLKFIEECSHLWKRVVVYDTINY